jgi:hypothetical protein
VDRWFVIVAWVYSLRMKLDDDYTILTDEESVEWRRIYIEPGKTLLYRIRSNLSRKSI